MSASPNGPDDPLFGETINAYARAQALADGALVDVSEHARDGMLDGFCVPVAVTAALWAAIRAIPPSLVTLADERGRLHDVLWMARLAAQRLRGASGTVFGIVLPCRGTRRRRRTLRIEVGPDDHGAPCVTIGFPEDF